MTVIKPLDRSMCAMVDYVLTKTTSLGRKRHRAILQLDGGLSVAEHGVSGTQEITTGDLPLEKLSLKILAIRHAVDRQNVPAPRPDHPLPDSTLILFGPEKSHETLADLLAR